MRQQPAKHPHIPFIDTIASIEPKLESFLSRLMLRSSGRLDRSDLDEDFERLDVLDGLHRPRREH